MNQGAKAFLALAGIGGAIGTVLLFTRTSKAAPKPAEPPAPEVVVVPPAETPHEPPAVVPEPPAPPGIDIAEASRLLLRWWSVEGEALLFSEEDRDKLQAQGFPVFFGTEPTDLGGDWTPRKQAVAAAFERLNGLTPDDGVPNKNLFDALVRWAKSQELLPPIPPKSPTEPAPQVIQPTPSPFQAPSSTEPTPTVVVPEPTAVPAPAPSSTPPFVPPLQQAAAPPLAVDQVLPAAQAVLASLTTPAPLPEPAPAATLPPAMATPAVLPTPAPVVPAAATAPDLVPAETAALVAQLLADEASNGWKKKSPAVTAWQKSRGLKQDGEFGPKSALSVAKEVGTVPIVRYWPKGALPNKAVPEYRAALLALAAQASEPRASQLRVSAARENGQGFGSNQTALPPAQRVQIAQVA